MAGVSIFTFRTIESPKTRALSSGFSVGVSLSGENLFYLLIGMEEWCFDRQLGKLTVTQSSWAIGKLKRVQSNRDGGANVVLYMSLKNLHDY